MGHPAFLLRADGTPYFPDYGVNDAVKGDLYQDARQYLIDTLAEPLDHAEAVAAGEIYFRLVINKCLGSYFGNNRVHCDTLADFLFRFLREAWRERYTCTAGEFLDKVHIASKESDAEIERQIEDGWELEIAGDERAMAQSYEGSARTRKGSFLGIKGGG